MPLKSVSQFLIELPANRGVEAYGHAGVGSKQVDPQRSSHSFCLNRNVQSMGPAKKPGWQLGAAIDRRILDMKRGDN